MPSPTAADVQVAATGALYVAALGTTAPTGATPSWAAGWEQLGYLSDDGLTENAGLDSDEIKAWQKGAIVRRVITGSREEFGFTVIQLSYKVLEVFYPGSVLSQVTGPPAETKLEIKLPVATPLAFGIDVVDGTMLERTIIPRGELFERGERSYQNAAARGYPMTINAVPDSSDVTAIRYFNPQLPST